ncbi:MAG: imidazolonepropionase [Nitrososphaerales archaeon]
MSSRPKADLVLKNIGQLVSMAGHSLSPAVRPTSDSIGLVDGRKKDLCMASSEGRLVYIGNSSSLSEHTVTSSAQEIDCGQRLVTPGFVDSHTHAIFAGSRERDLAMKIAGMSYLDILGQGGGILNTVEQTLEATDEELVAQTRKRLDNMISFGTTSFEVKSGYALTVSGEIRLLEMLKILASEGGYDIEPTLLSAHAIPKEYAGRNQAYIEDVVIPSINVCSERSLASFCDVFLEEGVFGFKEAERILSHALRCGLKIKIHADEFSDQGGARLASILNAASADHLGRASIDGMKRLARRGTLAVLLPGTLFSSFAGAYANAREMIELGVPIAIATDMSPNSWIESMQFVVSLASYGMRLSPAEALAAVTINGAHAISRAHDVGSLEVGKYFDALIFDLENYSQIPYRLGSNNVMTVVKRGKVIRDLQQ